MDASQDSKDRIARSEASATAFDLLSVAFAYPDREFRAALGTGEFGKSIQLCLDRLPEAACQAGAATRFRDALDAFMQRFAPEQLESDYLALFELNKDQPPLHLNAHLYTQGTPDPVPVYQRLLETYQRFGIEPRSGEGVEAPDHLAIQLEFLAYLYRRLALSLEGGPGLPPATIEAAIDAFHLELAWVERWSAALQQRGGHPLYGPLGELLCTLLQARSGNPK